MVVAYIGAMLAMPEQMMAALQAVRDWVGHNLGALIELLTLVAIVYRAWIGLGKCGNIQLGEAKPKRKTWAWP